MRRPPRGVPKSEFASQDWYDVWFPTLAPSPETLKLGQVAASDAEWKNFVRRYKDEMDGPEATHAINLLAVLSHTSNFSVGCYCEDERRCHRSLLRGFLVDAGAFIA